MFPLFAAAYGAVFLAEVAGDKLLYITGVLATRYRPVPVIAGALVVIALFRATCAPYRRHHALMHPDSTTSGWQAR